MRQPVVRSAASRYASLLSDARYLMLITSSFLYALGFYFFTWFLPILILRDYGAWCLGLTYAISTAVGLLAVVSGVASDVFGYKYLILGVPAFTAVSYIALLIKHNIFTVLLVAIALHVTALGGPPLSALLSVIVERSALGMAFSLYRLVMMVGFTVSSTLMAVVTQFFGLSSALLISLPLIAACILLRAALLKGVEPGCWSEHHSEPNVKNALREHLAAMLKALGVYGALTFLSFSLINALALSYGPFLYNFIKYVLGLNIVFLGVYESLSTVVNAALQPVAGTIVDRVSVNAIKYALCAETILSVVITVIGSCVSGQYSSLLVTIALALILAYELSGSVLSNAINVGVALMTRAEFRGSSYGLLTSLSSLLSMPMYVMFAYAWSVSPATVPLYYGLLTLVPLAIWYVGERLRIKKAVVGV